MDTFNFTFVFTNVGITMLLCTIQLIQYFYEYQFKENALAKLNYICCFLLKIPYFLFLFQVNHQINMALVMTFATTAGILNLAFVIRICHRAMKTKSLDNYILWVFYVSLPISTTFFLLC